MTPNPLWIKICANTTAEDALAAARLGADAVGFVFAPSTRRVNAAQVAAISPSLPPTLERVGVFPSASVEEIASVVQQARLHAVQLHGGDFDPAFTEALAARLGPDIALIHAVHWNVSPDVDSSGTVLAELAAIAQHRPGDRVLIDAKVGASPAGGTGRTFDWLSARTVLSSQPALRVIIAGGLQPANVAQAVRLLRPWGIDVASGVERTPGRKDLSRLQAFIENAREA